MGKQTKRWDLQQRLDGNGLTSVEDRVSSVETTGLRSSDEDEEERSVTDTDVLDLASSDGEDNGTDPDGGEGEMHRRQHPTAMAAQISNEFEDRASTPDILYISDSGGDTEMLMSDNDDEEGGGGGGGATEGEVSVLLTTPAIIVADMLIECEPPRDQVRGLDRWWPDRSAVPSQILF